MIVGSEQWFDDTFSQAKNKLDNTHLTSGLRIRLVNWCIQNHVYNEVELNRINRIKTLNSLIRKAKEIAYTISNIDERTTFYIQCLNYAFSYAEAKELAI